MLLRTLQRRDDAAKVLVVPPQHKDVRETFVARLTAAIGRDSVADLNEGIGLAKAKAQAETATALAKFRSGCGQYWQCAKCGAVHSDATPACATATFRIEIEGAIGASAEALCFITDVDKVNGTPGPNGQTQYAIEEGATIFIGNRVVVRRPGQPGREFGGDPVGRVLAKGSCNGRRPTSPAELLPAPAGSCFVLVLNASGIEGLDLGEATHLIKTEPMAREDKELQAEARGRRLGSGGQLQIVQCLMEGTVEEAVHASLAEMRQRHRGQEHSGRSSREGKRARAAGAEESADEAGQAAMLNSLKLLRTGGEASTSAAASAEQ